MIEIGLTGSIAMGKSEVARILVEAGLPLFDSDLEVHRFYDSAEGAALLLPFVPEAIHNGRVDRSLLSKIVIADQTKLNQLETLVHAEIANHLPQQPKTTVTPLWFSMCHCCSRKVLRRQSM
jgi:dephospho-CoA kinase